MNMDPSKRAPRVNAARIADILGPGFARMFGAAEAPASAPDAEAQIDAHFDAIDTDLARIKSAFAADGLIRAPGSRTRVGDRA